MLACVLGVKLSFASFCYGVELVPPGLVSRDHALRNAIVATGDLAVHAPERAFVAAAHDLIGLAVAFEKDEVFVLHAESGYRSRLQLRRRGEPAGEDEPQR